MAADLECCTDVGAEHMLADLGDNMQPHDSISRSPPFIKSLTNSP